MFWYALFPFLFCSDKEPLGSSKRQHSGNKMIFAPLFTAVKAEACKFFSGLPGHLHLHTVVYRVTHTDQAGTDLATQGQQALAETP
jgi:hypothetical protein